MPWDYLDEIYKLDVDIESDIFDDCVENVDVDTETVLTIENYFYDPYEHSENGMTATS